LCGSGAGARLRVDVKSSTLWSMTAFEIIEEIKQLPQDEQNKVMEFVRMAGEKGPLSPEELGDLAQRMVGAEDPKEADRYQAEIVRGFYGGRSHA
jgi:hypothetical protein